MKRMSIKNLLLIVVFALGLFASAFVNPNATSTVSAADSGIVHYLEFSTSAILKRISPSNIDDLTNYVNSGKYGDDTYTEYDYILVGDSGLLSSTSTSHGQQHSYRVEKNTYTLLSKEEKKIFGYTYTTYNYDTPTPVVVEEGTIISRFYSEITVNVDRTALPKEYDTTPTTSNAQLMSNGKYKVYMTDTASFTMPEFEGFKVNIGDVFTNTTSVNGEKNATINVVYMLDTDNTIEIGKSVLTNLNNDKLSSLKITTTINEQTTTTTLNKNNTSMIVPENTTLTIVATPGNKHLVGSITVDGVEYTDTNTYPEFTLNFGTDSSKTYVIDVEMIDAYNTLSCSSDANVSIKYNNWTQSIDSTIPRDTNVEITVSPKNGKYLTSYSLTGANNVTTTTDGKKVVYTFTTGCNENYVLSTTSEDVFTALHNNVVVNKHDINLMFNNDENSKEIVYNAIWNNAFSTNTELTLNDVSFEYYAGTCTIDFSKITILGINFGFLGTKDFDFYYPINEKIVRTKEQFCNYISNAIGNKISAADLSSVLSDDMVNTMISTLHDFGSVSSETIRLVFAGNEKYNSVKLNSTIECFDLREEIYLDLNDSIEIKYGSYLDDSAIINALLEGKNGVVTVDGDIVSDLNTELFLSSSLVANDVGEYQVNVLFPDDNYFYKRAEKLVTINITKADLTVDITNNIVNYQEHLNGTINKDFVVNFTPDIEIIDEQIDNIYFVMGLDLVDGELIARVDLNEMYSAKTSIEEDIINGVINTALNYFDPDHDGLTLAEFVQFMQNINTNNQEEGIEIETSYMDQLIELLKKVDETINIRIMIVNDGSDITPTQHGLYFAGVVSTDNNYNMAYDAGYLIITAELLDVKFVEDTHENNLKQFEYDGTQKEMIAEAYDINNEVALGNMTYYYAGLQTDGTFYASKEAPVHSGAYSVFAMFNNASEDGLPTQVGLGIGAMLIVPSDDATVDVSNKVHTYNGEVVDFKSMVTTTNSDAKVAYFTASINTNGDFSEDGFDALEGKINIDFPTRFDNLLKEYFPEQYTNGVNVDTFIDLLNKSSETLTAYGYSVEFIDNLVEVLGQMNNATTLTFKNLEEVNSDEIGVYLVVAMIFDPNYMPKVDMGILVIQPDSTIANLAWNFTDKNGVLTTPALSKVDLGATITNGVDAEVNYVFFGIDNNGKFVKLTNIEEVSTGVWLQLAYVPFEPSANVILSKPIARMFAVVPQNVEINFVDKNENNLFVRTYNASTHNIAVNANYLNGTAIDSSKITITYIGIDTMGNRYYSEFAPTNVGVYTIVASYIEGEEYVGFAVAELAILPANIELTSENTLVCFDGQAHNITFACDQDAEYIFAIENGTTLNIVLPNDWNLEDVSLNEQIMTIMAKYDVENIKINANLPTEIGEYNIHVIAINPNFNVAYTNAILIIQNHDTVYHDGLAATCTEDGYEAYYTCANCNYTTYSVIPAHGHTEEVIEAIAATCHSTGLTEGTKCSECNAILVAQEIVKALEHIHGEWVTINAPTCTAEGYAEMYCILCNDVLDTQVLDIIAHDTIFHAGIPATCTTDGCDDYYTCADCTYTTYQVIPAFGHTEETITGYAPTCINTGLTNGTKCSICQEILVNQETINALGHNEVILNALAATCHTTGLTEGKYCITCNTVLIAQKVVPQLQHIASDWIDVVSPTCTTEGLAHKVCTLCNTELDTMHLNITSHNTISFLGKAATCTEDGWHDYVDCRDCSYTTYVVIPAHGHTEVVDNAVEATCSTTGLTEGKHCSVCETILVEQNLIPTKEHTFDGWQVVVQSTATTSGRYERTCTACAYSEYKLIAPYGDKNIGNILVESNSEGKTTISTNTIDNAIKDVIETGIKDIVILTTENSNLNNVEFDISSIQDIVNADSTLTIQASGINATFNKSVLNTILSSADGEENVQFDLRLISKEELNYTQQNSIVNTNVSVIFSAKILCGNSAVSQFGDNEVEVRIPFEIAEGRNVEDFKIFYIADSGEIEEIDSVYDNGEMIVTLNHFSEYIIVDTFVAPHNNLALIIAIIALALFAAIAVTATVVFIRKENKR